MRSKRRVHRPSVLLGYVLFAAACTISHVPPSSGPPPTTIPPPPPQPTPPADDPLAVRPEPGPLTVAAWAEPAHLPPGGGQAHILVRLARRGGRPAAGVEVRLVTSRGRLYSGGRVLETDARGRTRDRLTTRRTAVVTLNAGGTRYSFVVPVLPRQAEPFDEMVEVATSWSTSPNDRSEDPASKPPDQRDR